MKSKLICCLCWLILGTAAADQEFTIKGKVIDEQQAAMSYVNIGILGTSIGTVSDLNGDFSIYLKSFSPTDTLVFSSIGYRTVQMRLEEIDRNGALKVEMARSDIQLTTIVVRSRNFKRYTAGKDKTNTDRRVNFSISSSTNQNLGSEIGKRFNFRKKAILQDFKFYVNHNDFQHVKFRINIYSVEKGEVSNKINRENILIDLLDHQTGWIAVDLRGYDLKVDDDIIVGVEWIEHSETGKVLSLPLIFPSIGSSHYYKYGSVSDFKRFRNISTSMILGYEAE